MKLSPANAALLSLLLPGLAHIVMKRTVIGAVCMAVTCGLFFLGLSQLGGRIWAFQWFNPLEMLESVTDIVPLNLWPELLNTGCAILASLLRDVGGPDALTASNALRAETVPVPGEHLWSFLTGASGILSVLIASDAHYVATREALPVPEGETAPPERPHRPGLMALISWMVPGAAHVRMGQKSKGLLMGAAILALFLMALFFSNGHGIDRQHSPAYWIAQSLFGGGALFASLVTSPASIEPPNVPDTMDLGTTLALVAGLLSMVVMIDAYTVAERGGMAERAAAEKAAAGQTDAGQAGAAPLADASDAAVAGEAS